MLPSFHSCLWSYWLCSFLVQLKVLLDVSNLPSISLPTLAHHSHSILMASNCRQPVLPGLPVDTDPCWISAPSSARHCSAAPGKVACSLLTICLYFQLSTACTPLRVYQRPNIPCEEYSLMHSRCLKVCVIWTDEEWMKSSILITSQWKTFSFSSTCTKNTRIGTLVSHFVLLAVLWFYIFLIQSTLFCILKDDGNVMNFLKRYIKDSWSLICLITSFKAVLLFN